MDILPPPALVLAAAVETAERALRLDTAYVRELARRVSPPSSTRCDAMTHTAYPARAERTLPHFPSPDFAHGRVLRLGTVIQVAVSVRRPSASVLFARGGEHLGISHG